jgi:hypothetical protein
VTIQKNLTLTRVIIVTVRHYSPPDDEVNDKSDDDEEDGHSTPHNSENVQDVGDCTHLITHTGKYN